MRINNELEPGLAVRDKRRLLAELLRRKASGLRFEAHAVSVAAGDVVIERARPRLDNAPHRHGSPDRFGG